MKLAEALLIRGEMQTRFEALKKRITTNILVQEHETPHEDAVELMAQASAILDEREMLVARINRTNLQAALPDGRSLTQVLARRDKLAARHAMLTQAAESSHREPDRYSMSEIKWVATINVKSVQKQADDLATELRELNTKLQQANWQIDLVE